MSDSRRDVVVQIFPQKRQILTESQILRMEENNRLISQVAESSIDPRTTSATPSAASSYPRRSRKTSNASSFCFTPWTSSGLSRPATSFITARCLRTWTHSSTPGSCIFTRNWWTSMPLGNTPTRRPFLTLSFVVASPLSFCRYSFDGQSLSFGYLIPRGNAS